VYRKQVLFPAYTYMPTHKYTKQMSMHITYASIMYRKYFITYGDEQLTHVQISTCVLLIA